MRRKDIQNIEENQLSHGGCCGTNLLFLKNMQFPELTEQLKKELEKKLLNEKEEDFQSHDNSNVATTIVYAKKIYTMEDQGTVDTMAFKDNKIIWTGFKENVEMMVTKNKKTQQIYYNGKTILPGLIDAHCHYFYLGMGSQFVSMKYKDDETPKQNYINRWKQLEQKVKDVEIINASNKGKKKWVFANGYDRLHMYEQHISQQMKKLHLSQLDKIGKNTPIFILEANTHIAHVNSKAFQQTNICPEKINIIGGSLGFDNNDKKKPNGMVIQPPAIALFSKKFPVPKLQQFTNSITKLMQDALSRGCTSIHDGGIGIMGQTPLQHLLAFYFMQKTLPIFQKIRVSGFITYELWQNHQNLFRKPKLWGDNLGANFRLTGIKFWYDGSIQGGSAFLQDPYLFKGQQFNGKNASISKEQLQKKTKCVINSQWPVAIHSSGDASFKDVAQAIINGQEQKSNKKKYQKTKIHRIQHCTFANQSDFEAISKASKQNYLIHPSFLINYISQYGKIYKQQLFSQGVAEKKMHLVGTSVKLGLNPSLHSDFIMQKIDPFAFIHDAVNRIISQKNQPIQVLNQCQKIDVFQAFKTITINAAKACYCDDIVGSLKAGKLADFIVLDEQIDLFDERNLNNIKVSETWVNGVCVFPLKKSQKNTHATQLGIVNSSRPTKRVKITKQQN